MIAQEKIDRYSDRPHTSSGINLADYKFGTFKSFESKFYLFSFIVFFFNNFAGFTFIFNFIIIFF